MCVWMNEVGGGGSSNLYSDIFPTQNEIYSHNIYKPLS